MIKELEVEEFTRLLQQYQSDHPATPAIEGFETEVERRAFEQLATKWENGWDFRTQFDSFGDRGVSILVQNRAVDWVTLWDWLVREYERPPAGAMINFEVWNNIQNNVMVAGEMILRRVILSSEIVAENPRPFKTS